MLLFGHAGITLAAAALVNGAVNECYFRNLLKRTESPCSRDSQTQSSPGWSRFLFLRNSVDIRLLLVGSLLPDIIDKPVGRLLFSEALGTGRIFSHTLLFFLLLFFVGLYLYRRRGKTWLLVLSAGVFSHLIMDRMWLSPKVTLWPLYGWTFQRETEGFWSEILADLLTKPGGYVPELIGLAVLGLFVWALVRRRSVWYFIKSGRI